MTALETAFELAILRHLVLEPSFAIMAAIAVVGNVVEGDLLFSVHGNNASGEG